MCFDRLVAIGPLVDKLVDPSPGEGLVGVVVDAPDRFFGVPQGGHGPRRTRFPRQAVQARQGLSPILDCSAEGLAHLGS